MRTRDAIWYDVGLMIGTVLVAGGVLVRRLAGRSTQLDRPDPVHPAPPPRDTTKS